jgi:hypothetical protein
MPCAPVDCAILTNSELGARLIRPQCRRGPPAASPASLLAVAQLKHFRLGQLASSQIRTNTFAPNVPTPATASSAAGRRGVR